MQIQHIELSDFRNYKNLSIDFSSGVNLLYGDNAQGKTNLLEAIYVSATTRSLRGSKDRELIRLGCSESHLSSRVVNRDCPHRVDMHLRKNKSKGVAVDGVPIKRSAELLGLLHVISFCPDDLSLVKAGPSERRRFLDRELSQIDGAYCSFLARYNRVLAQRNNLLKQISGNLSLKDTVSVWDEQLVLYGTEIIKRRRAFVEELRPVVAEKHELLSGGSEHLRLSYLPNVTEEAYADKLAAGLERDIILRATETGPHRDDIDFSVNDVSVRMFGSQGQQRTTALSLKLAEIALVIKKRGEAPILLLDDVLSELDRSRQQQLLSEIRNLQTIVTCTGMEEFVMQRSSENSIYYVLDGSVEQKSFE